MTSSPAERQLATPRGLVVLGVLLVCLRLGVAAWTGLTDDEAYYRLWSLAIAPSYLDHPPMVAILIRIGRTIAGDTALGARLLAPFLLAAGAVVLWRIARLYANEAVAAVSVLYYSAMPLLAVGGIVITPDLPSVLFYGLAIWTLFELSRSQNPSWWIVTGACAGLGLLSKFTNLFVGATILIWLLAVEENRKWFRHWQLWAGGGLAITLFLPVVLWNASHEWATFAKQFGRVTRDQNFGFTHFAELAGGYVALASPVVAVLSAAGLYRICRDAFTSRRSDDVLVAASIVPLLIYFIVHAMHGRVQANWLSPIYPMLALCAGVATYTLIPPTRHRRATAAATAIGLIMTAIVYAHALEPLIKLRKDPTNQIHGWTDLGGVVEKLSAAHGSTWIATSSYATTGQLSFAFKGRIPVVQLTQSLRYDNLPASESPVITGPGLYVELERRADRPLLNACFDSVRQLPSVTRAAGDAYQVPYAVYSVTGLKSACRPPGGFRFERRTLQPQSD